MFENECFFESANPDKTIFLSEYNQYGYKNAIFYADFKLGYKDV
jgi:hypothetical protein